MPDKTLGQKIRDFRIQAGKSQYELELIMNSSPGTISRIEKDKTNPTKETLLLVAKALNLDEYQTTSIFQIIPSATAKTLSVINEFSKLENLDDVLQVAANEINFRLGYISSAILLLEGMKLRAMSLGGDPISLKALDIIGKPVRALTVTQEADSNNLLLKSALRGEFYESSVLYDFTRGAIGKNVTSVIGKMVGFKKGLAVPLTSGNKCIGALYLSKSGREDYEFEKPVVLQIATQLAIKIESIRQIEHFKEQLKNAK